MKSLFYVSKNEKVTDGGFTRVLISSVLGILLCASCAASAAWAYFSCTASSGASAITAASYNIEVTVVKSVPSAEGEPTDVGGVYTLSEGSYTVTLTANGTASTGYCRVEVGDGTFLYTVPLVPAPAAPAIAPFAGVEGVQQQEPLSELVFIININCAQGTKVSFEPRWMGYSGVEDSKIISPGNIVDVYESSNVTISAQSASTLSLRNDAIFVEENGNIVHTVVEGETLAFIAESYNRSFGEERTTAEKIAVYNSLNVDIDAVLGAGIKLIIPPFNYKVEDGPYGADNQPGNTPEGSSDEPDVSGSNVASGGGENSDDTNPPLDNSTAAEGEGGESADPSGNAPAAGEESTE